MEDLNNTAEVNPIVDKKNKGHKFKALTFFSGVLSILLCAGLIGFGIYVVVLIFPALINKGGAEAIAYVFLLPLFFIMIAILVVAAVVYMIFGILMVVSSFGDDKAYKKWKGLIIATIVLDILVGVLSLIFALVLENDQAFAGTVFFVIAGVIVASLVLKIVDLVLLKKRLAKTAQIETAKTEAVVEKNGVDFSKLSENQNLETKSDEEKSDKE